MNIQAPAHSFGTMDDNDGEADPARRLEQLRLRSRQLERQRINASPTMNRARLVALDVELCRVEAAKRMLVPSGHPNVFDARGTTPISGALQREPMSSPFEPGEARSSLRDVLYDMPETIRRSEQREDRHRQSRT